MLEQANIDIGKAMAVESRRHTDEVRTNLLISQIDELPPAPWVGRRRPR